MDLVLKILKMLTCLEIQPTNQPINQPNQRFIAFVVIVSTQQDGVFP